MANTNLTSRSNDPTTILDLPLSTDIVTQVELDNALASLSGDYATKAEVESAVSAKTEESDVIDIINQQVNDALSNSGGGGEGDIAGNYAFRSKGGIGTQVLDYDYETGEAIFSDVTSGETEDGKDYYTVIKAGHADVIKDFFEAIKNGDSEFQGSLDLLVEPNTYSSFDDYLQTKTTEEIKQIVSDLNNSRIAIVKMNTASEESEAKSVAYQISSDNHRAFNMPLYGTSAPKVNMFMVNLDIGSGGQTLEEFNATPEELAWYASSGQWLMDKYLADNIDAISAAYYANQLTCDEYSFYWPEQTDFYYDLRTKQQLDYDQFFEPGIIGLHIYMAGGSGTEDAAANSPFRAHYSDIGNAYKSDVTLLTQVCPTADSPEVPVSALVVPGSGADSNTPIWKENLNIGIFEQKARVQFFESSVIQTSIGGGGEPSDNALTAFATKTSLAELTNKVNTLDEIHESLDSIDALPTDGSIANIDIINKVNALIAALKK